MDIAVSPKRARRRGETKKHIRMNLRLRNNEVAGPCMVKPYALRSFCPGSLSLLAHRSLKNTLAGRSANHAKIALGGNIQNVSSGCYIKTYMSEIKFNCPPCTYE